MNREFTLSITTTPSVALIVIACLVVIFVAIKRYIIDIRIHFLIRKAGKQSRHDFE